MKISRQIARAIKRLGMSYADVATAICCTRQAVGLWARGERRPRRKYWAAIKGALGVDCGKEKRS
jgi:transcriptional regulator with XRE-family HTH domain